MNPECLFCKIVDGSEPSGKVLETKDFLVVENKFPAAPVHVLVIDKIHREKKDTLSGKYDKERYWDRMFAAAHKVIKQLNLDKTGYKIVNNGAGYNHFEHEHIHILGGTKEEPGGVT